MTQKGFAPILLVLLAAAGIIIYLLASSTLPFKEGLFSLLYPKPSSFAQGPSVEDEILVKFKPGVPDQARERILNSHALEKIDSIPEIGVELTKVAPQARDNVIEALKHNPLVEYAELNFILQAQLIPNDPAFPNQWALTKIGAPAAWDISTGSSPTIIAILDTGIDINHEDLVGKYLDSPSPDDNGHGTQVSGIAAAATNNSKGVAGVCWLCPILSLKVLSSTGIGSDSSVANGIVTAANQGVRVINLSLGSYASSQSEQNAVNYAWSKGVVVVGAAGNDNLSSPFYPAALNNVIAVGSTTGSDSKSSTSNYGSWLDVMAPGVSVTTTRVGNLYTAPSGTSMAAPHVSGLAGLIFSANPLLTNTQVVDIITSTALDLGDPGFDQYYGWGRIQADKALQKASGITVTPDTTAPTTSITSPTSGSTVSAAIDITADATDNVGVTKVEFYIDGVLFAIDVTPPYLSSWDTTTLSNSSSHTLQTKAYDLAGNAGNSSVVTVTVNNTISTPTPNPNPSDTTPPTVSITQPLDGTILPRNTTVTILADASDNVKVSKVEFSVNNSIKCTDTTSPYTCNWKVPGKRGASYTISAKAYDSSNNQASANIKVTAQ